MTTSIEQALRSGAALARVKPLEWAEDSRLNRDYRSETAKTSIGRYEVFSFIARSKPVAGWTSTLSVNESNSASLEEAKAAAQADYSARILSALSPDPALVALIEGRDRLKVERDALSSLAGAAMAERDKAKVALTAAEARIKMLSEALKLCAERDPGVYVHPVVRGALTHGARDAG